MRFAWLLLASCGNPAFDVDASRDALPADLLLYYPMDEPVASGTVPDATGHRDGHCTGGSCPGALAIGSVGGALIFDGDDMIGIMSGAELEGLAEYTASLWIRFDGSSPACMFGKRAGTTDGNTWQLCVNANRAVTLTSYNGTTNVVTTTSTMLTGAYDHLAVTWDATTQTETFYVGGEWIGSQAVTKVWDSGELLIGGDVDDDNPTSFFVGVIDDVRLYGRALSATEIRELAQL